MDTEAKKRITLRELFGPPPPTPTQVWVASELGVDKSIVNRWVNGKSIPNGYNLQRIARLFEISADDIDLQVPEGGHTRSAETTRVA